MANSRYQNGRMAILCLIAVATFGFADAQSGVAYGMLGDNLPQPSDVVNLFTQNNIQRMRIYSPDPATLSALSGSNIQLTLGVPNSDLPNIAASQDNANDWVQNNVINYPNVNFRYIAVGNEVSPVNGAAQYAGNVLPAMQNIQNAINGAGLPTKVSTSVEMGLLGNSYPPAAGSFRDDVGGYIQPIVNFLVSNNAPLLVNVYPYFAYIGDKNDISLEYALFTSDGVTVPGGTVYQNLFYAMVDAVYAAMSNIGGSSVPIVVSETGWPTDGGDSTSVDNARTYNTNLLDRVKSGTPLRPGQEIETYIFAMFDENEKNPEYEKHWGLFFPDETPKYPISFS